MNRKYRLTGRYRPDRFWSRVYETDSIIVAMMCFVAMVIKYDNVECSKRLD